MDYLNLFNALTINALVKKKPGESKFGEQVKTLPQMFDISTQLKNFDAKYVLFGIPENVGVFANNGKLGTTNAWEATLKNLLNIQNNRFIQANKVLILGTIDCSKELKSIHELGLNNKKTIKKARKLVSNIDTYVSDLVYQIVRAGKIPIIIGGGQNNAYGNIKGTALAKNTAINAVNLNTQTDFRSEEGRHSGNGFSYAYAEGFLNNYFIFGLHENYFSEKNFKTINKIKSVQYNTFEAIKVKKELKFKAEMYKALNHVSKNSFGIEIDCGAIQNISSSTKTPSGFSVNNTREFVSFFGKHKKAAYFHICEAAPKKKKQDQVGKLISYLITDFIKANPN